MKKIALIFAFLMAALILSGCATNNSAEYEREIQELQDRITELEAKVAEYETSSDLPFEVQDDEVNPVMVSTQSNDAHQAMMDYLSKQAGSNDYDNWMEVAKCEQATENHLLTVAKKCVAHSYNGLAEQISSNSSATGEVMAELASSNNYDILAVVAQSPHSDETALKLVASKCRGHDWPELAKKIETNPNTTESVMTELSLTNSYDILAVVTQSKKSNELALQNVAKKCVYYDWPMLAQKIANNPNATVSVLQILGNSTYSSVASVGHKAIEKMLP